MSEIDRIIAQHQNAFDGDPWHGDPLMTLLANVAAQVASARPIPGAHTIREIVRHLTFWYDGAARRLDGHVFEADETEQWPAGEENGPDEAAWQREREDLTRAHRAFLEAVTRLDDADLDRPVPGKPYDVYYLLHGLVQHLLYHAGQVAILKRAAAAAG